MLAGHNEVVAGQPGLGTVELEGEVVAALEPDFARSSGTWSPMSHWPKTRMIGRSPSWQRANMLCPSTVKATSPSSSIAGASPRSG